MEVRKENEYFVNLNAYYHFVWLLFKWKDFNFWFIKNESVKLLKYVP